MEKEKSTLSRREFLRTSGLAACSLILPEWARARSKESIYINERVIDILSKMTSLSFDDQGNLLVGRGSEQVFVQPTLYNQENLRESDKMKSVELFVIHYDAASSHFVNGQPRTALHTVERGLDAGYKSSVHWSVDEFPIRYQSMGDGYGYGILQTQLASGDNKRPFKGEHILIGVDLSSCQKPNDTTTCRPDTTWIKTSELMERIGIQSKLNFLVEQGDRDLDKYAVGIEQVGVDYSANFPTNFPPEQQIANVLSLSLAVMKQHNLTPWDIVGHHEIQEKQDPGDEYMATIRYLIGVAGLKNMVNDKFIFGDYLYSLHNYFREYHLGPYAKYYDYFSEVGNYYRARDRYGQFKKWDDYVGYSQLLNDVKGMIRDQPYYPKFRYLPR